MIHSCDRRQKCRELREKVQAHVELGHRVLSVLMSFGGIEQRIRKRLEGLEYTMTTQALMPDERIVHWVLASGRALMLKDGEASTRKRADRHGAAHGIL